MGDCGVCLSGYDGDSSFCHIEIRKERKSHRCSECEREIMRGEKYEHATGKSDGDLWSFDTCLLCAEIADTFYCEGRLFGGMLWDEMQEIAFPVMNTACLDRLETAAAKTFLLKRWSEWKFR